MRVAFATDERTAVTDALQGALGGRGPRRGGAGRRGALADCGRLVGEVVVAGLADAGIVMCWTGTGVSIAANKVPGVRAALCTDVETARGARRWNDANVLALGLRLSTETVAVEIADAFLAAEADPSEADTIALVEGEWHR